MIKENFQFGSQEENRNINLGWRTRSGSGISSPPFVTQSFDSIIRMTNSLSVINNVNNFSALLWNFILLVRDETISEAAVILMCRKDGAEATNERNSLIKAAWIWDLRFLTNRDARCWSRKTSVLSERRWCYATNIAKMMNSSPRAECAGCLCMRHSSFDDDMLALGNGWDLWGCRWELWNGSESESFVGCSVFISGFIRLQRS